MGVQLGDDSADRLSELRIFPERRGIFLYVVCFCIYVIIFKNVWQKLGRLMTYEKKLQERNHATLFSVFLSNGNNFL
jgi:hypothetical protein